MAEKTVRARHAIIGVAGYVARRHIDAVRQTGGELVAAFDVFDSVGQMNHFPDALFFSELSEFSRFINQMRSEGRPVDYITICSPNHLHRAHIEFALRHGADVICEKPLVLEPQEVDEIGRVERQVNRKVFTILQLRLNTANQDLRNQIRSRQSAEPILADLTYVTARGNWYFGTWKGDDRKSGGVTTNIGIHLFDLLGFFFGQKKSSVVHLSERDCAAGILEFALAKVRWFLSINERDLPKDAENQEGLNRATRSLIVGDTAFDLSGDFANLHTISYREILAGRGFGLEIARPAIETASEIRRMTPKQDIAGAHPSLQRVLVDRKRGRNVVGT